jgi:hypothetical protein
MVSHTDVPNPIPLYHIYLHQFASRLPLISLYFMMCLIPPNPILLRLSMVTSTLIGPWISDTVVPFPESSSNLPVQLLLGNVVYNPLSRFLRQRPNFSLPVMLEIWLSTFVLSLMNFLSHKLTLLSSTKTTVVHCSWQVLLNLPNSLAMLIFANIVQGTTWSKSRSIQASILPTPHARALGFEAARRLGLYKDGKSCKMTPEHIRELNDIGFNWKTDRDFAAIWSARFNELCEYKVQFGHCSVPFRHSANPELGALGYGSAAHLQTNVPGRKAKFHDS